HEQDEMAHQWAWAWPANRRILYNRASADLDGNPWSERKKLVWWDEDQADGQAMMSPISQWIVPPQAKLTTIKLAQRRWPEMIHSSCKPTEKAGSLLQTACMTDPCPPTSSRLSPPFATR